MSSNPERVNHAHSDKPDSDEPWRYVCPNCGGQVAGGGNRLYRCSTCGKDSAESDLRDKKTGKRYHELV